MDGDDNGRAVEPVDYAKLNAVYGALFAGVLIGAYLRDDSDDQIPVRELVPLSAATFALSKVIAREKIGSWMREPFVEQSGGERRPRGTRLQRAVGELVTCTRCVGAWSALGVVGLRVIEPRSGRIVDQRAGRVGRQRLAAGRVQDADHRGQPGRDRRSLARTASWPSGRSRPGVFHSRQTSGDRIRVRHPMETLRYTTTERDGTAVLSLSGELVFETARKVERELRIIEERQPDALAIDLSGLSMIDSTGLALVVSADSRARGEGRRLIVVEGPDSVQRVFRMTRLDDRLEIVPSLEAGLDGARRASLSSSELRQLLLQLHDRGEQVAVLLDALEHVRRGEREHVRVLVPPARPRPRPT